MRAIAILVQLIVVMSGAACARGKAPEQLERAGARRSDRIGREEITARNWTDAYEIVATLRPNWLVERGRDSFGSGTVIQVVMNGVRMGGVTSLRRIPAADVEHFQYYDATAATTRWGMSFGKGAIELSTTPPR
jgi:hypothetical protein